MKKRMISLALAALLCVALGAGAFAQEQVEYTDQIWDIALAWNEAACINSSYEMKLTGDFVSDVHEGSFDVDWSAEEYVYSDGQKAISGKASTSAPEAIVTEFEIASMQDSGNTVTYWASELEGESVLYRVNEDQDITGDPQQLVLLFAQIGDEQIDVQASMDGADKKLSFALSGEALKNVVDAVCHPILRGSFGESADWDAITAQMTLTLPAGEDTGVVITLESQSLGEALIASVEGVQSVENAQLAVAAGVDMVPEESDTYTNYHITPEIISALQENGANIIERTGESQDILSVVRVMDTAYRPGWEELTGKESAKDALRAQLAGTAEEPTAEEPAPEE